jgi:hypothetical protein
MADSNGRPGLIVRWEVPEAEWRDFWKRERMHRLGEAFGMALGTTVLGGRWLHFFRDESFAIAQALKAHAATTGRTLTAFALAWLWANPILSSVIAGPRTLEQWNDYVAAIGTAWSPEDEALVDTLVRPGHPSTPGYTDPQYPFYGRRRLA